MAISAEHRSKFAALHRSWWRLHMSERGIRTPNLPLAGQTLLLTASSLRLSFLSDIHSKLHFFSKNVNTFGSDLCALLMFFTSWNISAIGTYYSLIHVQCLWFLNFDFARTFKESLSFWLRKELIFLLILMKKCTCPFDYLDGFTHLRQKRVIKWSVQIKKKYFFNDRGNI